MNKLTSLIAVLMIAGITPFAWASDKEICLAISANNASGSPIPYFVTLTYDGVRKGHVRLYGEDCFSNQGPPPTAKIEDCFPVSGIGVFHEDKIEIQLNGAENNSDLGVPLLTVGNYHISLSLTDYTGVIAGELLHRDLQNKTNFQQFQTGTVTAVACPVETKQEKANDRNFARALRNMGKLK